MRHALPSSIFLILLLMTGCRADSNFDPSEGKYPGVDQRLWQYFASFENEAARRGLAINLHASQITAQIEMIHEDNVAGLCSYGHSSPGEITIDASFWDRSTDLSREMIVFHELGHCYLKRTHLDEAFANGYCISIMRSGTCCCRDAYSQANRIYYLDELFDAMLPQ